MSAPALEMQEALARRRQQVHDAEGIEFHMRVGIHTGSAIAGTLGNESHQGFTVIGDTVNLANRLESAATADKVLVSAATYQQTWPLFEYKEVPNLSLKGFGRRITAYQPLGPRARPIRVRGLPGFDSPMIGRVSTWTC